MKSTIGITGKTQILVSRPLAICRAEGNVIALSGEIPILYRAGVFILFR